MLTVILWRKMKMYPAGTEHRVTGKKERVVELLIADISSIINR